MSEIDFSRWTSVAESLPWGARNAFRDVLELAEAGDITLVYGADYRDAGACLVNQAANMLVVGGGNGIPMEHFGPLVSEFDSINNQLENLGVNTDYGIVSPLGAEVLLQHFPPYVDIEATEEPDPTPIQENYKEKTDEELKEAFIKMFEAPAPVEEVNNEHQSVRNLDF